MDDYCNYCGVSKVYLSPQADGKMICDVCSYKELQKEMDEYQLIKETRERRGHP